MKLARRAVDAAAQATRKQRRFVADHVTGTIADVAKLGHAIATETREGHPRWGRGRGKPRQR